MVGALVLVVIALRAGLAIRKRRVRGLRPQGKVVQRHVRFAKPAVALVVVGLVGGTVSAFLLRGWEPLRSAHGILGVLSAVLFCAAAVLGRRVMQGERSAVAAHGAVGAVAALAAGVAAVAGFVLLP